MTFPILAASLLASLNVTFDPGLGGVSSVSVPGDAPDMNWVAGNAQWGVPVAAPVPGLELKFAGARADGPAMTAVWRSECLRIDVTRTRIGNSVLRERYVFTDVADYPVYIRRGDLGIYATFNDSYAAADVSLRARCHAHLWCQGAGAYVRAVKMGGGPFGLGLALTEGELDSYSQVRFRHLGSNDRGDFILHPAPFKLEPGESRVLEWELFSYADGRFDEAYLRRAHACRISFENETVFSGERFRLTATAGERIRTAEARLNGTRIACRFADRTLTLDVRPNFLGEARFELLVNGRTYPARGWVSPSVERLVAARVRKIISENQCRDASSRLDGAYLIWDNEEKRPHFGWRRRDWNASRERVGMALLLARWAQRQPSQEIADSLARYERFLLREIVDEKTGAVSDTVGHDDSRVRHYNAPWFVSFWFEMYRLTDEDRYLDLMRRGIVSYFTKAAPGFYPIACNFAECVALLEERGRPVDDLKALLRAQAKAMIARGNAPPSQEVAFEQTLVTPAITVLSGYCQYVARDPAALACISDNLATLARFQGDQPDHRLHDVSIRHWDGHWFGKREQYGDTFPHYWTCLSAHDWLWQHRLFGDESARRRAERAYRNLLCLFRPDGSASCAYLYPFSITMLDETGRPEGPRVRGEFEDPWANDQDYGLYFALKDAF